MLAYITHVLYNLRCSMQEPCENHDVLVYHVKL